MKRKTNTKDIIKTLQNMPDVVDKLSKDELYNRTLIKINKVEHIPIYKKKWLPILGLVSVVIILLVVLPSFMKQNDFFSSQKQTSDMVSNNKEESSDDYNNQENKTNNTEETLDSSTISKDSPSNVAQLAEDEVAIYVSLVDAHAQYFVPITLVVDNTKDLSTFYNNIPGYLDENSWGVEEYLFNGASFEIDLNQNEVSMTLSDDFDIEPSSALAYAFESVLMGMFLPYNINNVVFETDKDEGIDLGPLGVIKELPLEKNVKPSYKVYQLSDETEPFLVPIPYEDITSVSMAFKEMKVSEEGFYVTQSIPDHVTYKLESNDKELYVYFDDNVVLEDEQEYVMMIDAMLFAAKEYDYKSIQFKNASTGFIGPYDLSELIPIPDIVNPVYINE